MDEEEHYIPFAMYSYFETHVSPCFVIFQSNIFVLQRLYEPWKGGWQNEYQDLVTVNYWAII